MAVQGSINSALGKNIGLWETTFLVHLTAAVILVGVLATISSNIDRNIFSRIPWYLYLGGVLGVLITYGVAMSIPELGVAVATTSIIVGQVLTACLIDHLGLFGLEKVSFTWVKFAGVVFLALGARLLLD
ncbi:MAG: DMT family transporter [Desulfobia sp.]